MRKRTINSIADTGMWYLIYLLPLLVLLVALINTPIADVWQFVENSGFARFSDTIIFKSLSDIFGESGILPLFTGNTNVFFLYYATYFVCVMICHLCVDFLLFIPRLAHKWLNKFTQGD